MKKSERGEIATFLMLGTLVVLGVSTFVTSLFIKNNNNISLKTRAADSCSSGWYCMGECASPEVVNIFGGDKNRWMKEKAANTYYSGNYSDQTVWYCASECADQSVVEAFGGDRQNWENEKKTSVGASSCDEQNQRSNNEPTPVTQQILPTSIPVVNSNKFSEKYYSLSGSGKSFDCAYSAENGKCYGGIIQDSSIPETFNNCLWVDNYSEEVFCQAGQKKDNTKLSKPTATIIPTQVTRVYPTEKPLSTAAPMSTPTVSPTDTITVSQFLNLTEQDITVLSKEIGSGDANQKKIAITFDAGADGSPWPTIKDALQKFNVKITVFLTGDFISKYPDYVGEMIDMGLEIGNHSMTHPKFTELSEDQIKEEITSFQKKLNEIYRGTYPTRFFRFPYGDRDGRVRPIVAEAGLQSVYWSNPGGDSGGWKDDASMGKVLTTLKNNLRPGQIFVQHISALADANILDTFISYAQNQGYDIVPVSQVLSTAQIPPSILNAQRSDSSKYYVFSPYSLPAAPTPTLIPTPLPTLTPVSGRGPGMAAPAINPVMVIDPGHGDPDNDEGKALEGRLNLAVAQTLRNKLIGNGVSVRLTHEQTIPLELKPYTDLYHYADLQERVDRINRYADQDGARFFLSIHFDASDIKAKGTAGYINLDRSNEIVNENKRLAKTIVDKLSKSTGTGYGPTFDRSSAHKNDQLGAGVGQDYCVGKCTGPLYLLGPKGDVTNPERKGATIKRESKIPGALFEYFYADPKIYYSNADKALTYIEILNNKTLFDKIVKGYCDGILSYVTNSDRECK